MNGYNDVVQQIIYAFRLTQVRIQQEVKRFTLGFVWWFLDPLINTVILYVVVAHVLQIRTDDTAMFLLTGLLMFRFLSSSINSACTSLSTAFSLSSRLYVPKYVFVIRDIFAETFKFFIGIVVLAVLLGVLGKGHFSLLETTFVLFTAFVFVMGVASLMAVIGAIFNDIRMILGYVFRVLFFVSGLFFPLERVPAEWRDAFLMNPFALFVHEFRLALLSPDGLDYLLLVRVSIAALLIGSLGFYLLVKYDRTLPKYVI